MDAIWCYGWLLKLMASAQSLTFPFASAQGPSPAGKWPLFSWACSWVWRNFITVGLHLILHSISLEGNETHHGSMDQWCSSDLLVANLTEPLIRASNKRRFSAARRSNSWRWGHCHWTRRFENTGNGCVLFLLLSAFHLWSATRSWTTLELLKRNRGIMATHRQREGQAILCKCQKGS